MTALAFNCFGTESATRSTRSIAAFPRDDRGPAPVNGQDCQCSMFMFLHHFPPPIRLMTWARSCARLRTPK